MGVNLDKCCGNDRTAGYGAKEVFINQNYKGRPV